MKKYQVEITETLQRMISVEADNEKEALDIIKGAYKKEDIVLDWSDFIDVEFDVVENGLKYKKPNRKKQIGCECGCCEVVGIESNVVNGGFYEKGNLFLKGGEPLGVEDLKCSDCGKDINGDFKIEFG